MFDTSVNRAPCKRLSMSFPCPTHCPPWRLTRVTNSLARRELSCFQKPFQSGNYQHRLWKIATKIQKRNELHKKDIKKKTSELYNSDVFANSFSKNRLWETAVSSKNLKKVFFYLNQSGVKGLPKCLPVLCTVTLLLLMYKLYASSPVIKADRDQ